MSAQSKTRPRWLWGSVWKCPRKSNAKYPHPPVYLPEIPSSNSRFAAQQPRTVIFICAGRTPAESPAKSISNATRMRSSHETLKMQMAALARKYFLHRINGRSERRLYHHSRLHGRSLKRSAPRNTHTRLFIESSPASRPFGAATAHAKDARPGEKEKARKGHLFPPVLLRPRGSVSGLGPRQRRAKGRAALRGIERR